MHVPTLLAFVYGSVATAIGIVTAAICWGIVTDVRQRRAESKAREAANKARREHFDLEIERMKLDLELQGKRRAPGVRYDVSTQRLLDERGVVVGYGVRAPSDRRPS